MTIANYAPVTRASRPVPAPPPNRDPQDGVVISARVNRLVASSKAWGNAAPFVASIGILVSAPICAVPGYILAGQWGSIAASVAASYASVGVGVWVAVRGDKKMAKARALIDRHGLTNIDGRWV